MVYYFDEAGEIHYVNPDLMPIPPQYMNQVRPQLEALKAAREKEGQNKEQAGLLERVSEGQEQYVLEGIDNISSGEDDDDDDGDYPLAARADVVVIFEKGDIVFRRLVALLSTNGVTHRQLNLATRPEARDMYEDFKEFGLPLVIIDNNQVIPGSDLGAVQTALTQRGLIRPKNFLEKLQSQ